MSRSDYLWMCHRFSCKMKDLVVNLSNCNSEIMECYLAGGTNSKGFWRWPKAVIGFETAGSSIIL